LQKNSDPNALLHNFTAFKTWLIYNSAIQFSIYVVFCLDQNKIFQSADFYYLWLKLFFFGISCRQHDHSLYNKFHNKKFIFMYFLTY